VGDTTVVPEPFPPLSDMPSLFATTTPTNFPCYQSRSKTGSLYEGGVVTELTQPILTRGIRKGPSGERGCNHDCTYLRSTQKDLFAGATRACRARYENTVNQSANVQVGKDPIAP
jgi:hypothetical protein